MLLISWILLTISLVLLAVWAVLMVLKVVLWGFMMLLHVAIFVTEYFEGKPEQVQVEIAAQISADEEVAITLTQSEDGTWVLK
jgi:hypothetical protein